MNIYRMRLEKLLRATELHEPRVILADLAKRGSTPEEAANLLRVYWHVPPGPIRNLTSLVEAAGIMVVPFDFGSASVDGLSIYEPNDTLPPIIFLNAHIPTDRWRWTLAHELGHVVLHHHLQIPPDEKDIEAEGHRFAQEFMMPAREIAGQLGGLTMARLAQLKRHWGTSMRALLKRAEGLQRITERQARYLWMQISRKGIAEPVELEREEPTILRTLVSKHLGELGYSLRELGEMLHQTADDFRADFGMPATHLRLA